MLDLFGRFDEAALITLCFVFSAAAVYAGGGSYSEQPFLGGIGLLTAIPITVLNSLGNAFAGGVLLPLFVLAMLAYFGVLGKAFGSVAALAMAGSIVILLGA